MRNFYLNFAYLLLTFGTNAISVEAVLRDDVSVSTAPGAPLTNGKANYLRVSQTDYTFLRFEFDSVLPDGTTSAQIAKATLRLWCAGGRVGGACDVSPVKGPWSESSGGIFPKALPTMGPAVTATGHDLNGGFLVIDVTTLVRDWVSGTPNWGFALHGVFISGLPGGLDGGPGRPASPMNLIFDSKENPFTGHLPTLQIVLRP